MLIETARLIRHEDRSFRSCDALRAMANPDDSRVLTLDTIVDYYVREDLPEWVSTRTFYLPWIKNYIRPKWGEYR